MHTNGNMYFGAQLTHPSLVLKYKYVFLKCAPLAFIFILRVSVYFKVVERKKEQFAYVSSVLYFNKLFGLCFFLYHFNLINVTAGVNVKDKIAWVEIET